MHKDFHMKTMKENVQSQTTSMEVLIPIIRERLAEGQSIRFSPKGTSMLPMLRENRDTVTLSPLPEKLKKYDLPLYRRANGQYVLHRIVQVTAESGEDLHRIDSIKTGLVHAPHPIYTCRGDNQVVSETGLSHDRMIALVTGFTRNGREHSVQEPGYRIYCRLWYAICPARKLYRRIRRKLAGIRLLRKLYHMLADIAK